MISYDSIQELADKATKKGKRISELVLEDQALHMEQSNDELFELMRKSLHVMAAAAEKGLTSQSLSASGLSGGDANKMKQRLMPGRALSGSAE
jgi:hypothetical protein